MDPSLQRAVLGIGLVLWGAFATIFPYYAAMIGRLTYSLTWPGEGFEPRYPEIWLARVMGVGFLGFGVYVLSIALG